MKSFFSLTSFATVLLTFMLSCAQDKNAPSPVEGRPINLSARVSGQTTDFAFALLKKIEASEPQGDNLFVSPLSLHIALGMLVNGAEGETKSELLQTLKADNLSTEELNTAYQVLLRDLPEADKNVTLAVANSMWSRKGLSVKKNFNDVLSTIFNSEIYTETFDSGTVQKINQWASDNTNGKINKVIEQIDQSLVMFLMNALYFKGDWRYSFDKARTQDWNFRLHTGADKKVKMMFVESDLRCYGDTDFAAVELPYSSGQFNFTFFVPADGKSVNELIQQFDHEKWNTVQTGMGKIGIRAGLPKFTMEYEIQLKRALKQMGMNKPFTEAAEFSGISDAGLMVNFVKQNTFLAIDEVGTEAAAVTTIGVGVTSETGPRPLSSIIADRPFFFVISENTSNTILFTGRITNP